MNFLGIETSCDETAAAVVRDGRKILSNVVASSLKEHQRYGCVVPEGASRRQLEFIQPVVDESLEQAGLTSADIDALAVTKEPGLIGSLLVGISFARALSAALDKPLVEIDHVKAHVYANFLAEEQPRLPAVGMVVSGGHTDLSGVRTSGLSDGSGKRAMMPPGKPLTRWPASWDWGIPGGRSLTVWRKASRRQRCRLSMPRWKGLWILVSAASRRPFCITGKNTGTRIIIRLPRSPARFRKVLSRSWLSKRLRRAGN